MKTWQIILATVAIFVAGLVTGGATAVGLLAWIHREHGMNARLGGHAGGPQQVNAQLMRNFAVQLELTREQRFKVGLIMRRTSRMMQEEVADILTPEQRVKFEELIREQRARIQQYRQAQQRLESEPPPQAEPAK